MARAVRVYALVLRLYPYAHRQAFGEQMLRTFEDHYRDVVEAHGESESRFWLAVVGVRARACSESICRRARRGGSPCGKC
jgi:hypothetical protein